MKWLGRREVEQVAGVADAMRKPIRAAGMRIIMDTLAARHAARFGPVAVEVMIDAAANMLWTSPHVRTIYASLESLKYDLDHTLMAPPGTAWRRHVVSNSEEPFDGDDLMRTAHEARVKVLTNATAYPIKGTRFKR